MSSRVACVGANGAGKSTLIKVLTGETEATEGTVWKHPNLRIAYVAQHAFHHIEQHLDKTPNEYIQWRYAVGEDREALVKATRQETAEDKAAKEKVHQIKVWYFMFSCGWRSLSCTVVDNGSGRVAVCRAGLHSCKLSAAG